MATQTYNPDQNPENLSHLTEVLTKVLYETGLDVVPHDMVSLLVEVVLQEKQATRIVVMKGVDFWLERAGVPDDIRDAVSLLCTRLVDTEDGIAIDESGMEDGEVEQILLDPLKE